jgi:hypothetical protein
MPTETPSVPDVIWSQVSLATKMACGARSPLGSGNTLTFVVLSGKQYRIEVTLDPSDTYTVRYIKLSSRGTGFHVLEEATDVYCDNLSEVIYHMVNK